MKGDLSGRIFVTLGGAALAAVLGLLPLPGVRLPANLPGAQGLLGLDALGLTPILSAFVVVELFALIVPRWRPLRTGGPEGRLRLGRAALGLGLFFALIQAAGLVRWMQSVEALAGPAFLVVLSALGGTFVLVALAGIVERRGLGRGFSVVLGAAAGAALLRALGEGPGELMIFALAVGAIVLVTLRTLLIRTAAKPGPGEPATVLPLPVSGMVPLTFSAGLLMLASALLTLLPGHDAWLERLAVRTSLYDALDLGLVLALGLFLGWLFNRPSRVAGAWARSRGVPEQRPLFEKAARAMLLPALVRTLLFLAFVWIALRYGGVRAVGLVAVGATPIVVLTAVVLDLVREAAFRKRHGMLAAVWPLHRLYAVDPLLEALELAGIAAHPSGLHHRALLHFFGPYVPVVLLVPEADAAGAREILETIA